MQVGALILFGYSHPSYSFAYFISSRNSQAHADSHPRNLCLRESLSEPHQDRALPEVQAGHDAHGEEPKAAHHAAARPRDDETDIQQTKIRMYF